MIAIEAFGLNKLTMTCVEEAAAATDARVY
jgi:hypothetical protein